MTTKDKLGFGICGLGFMGRTYFTHLREHPAARVAAVFDRDEKRRNGDWGDGVGNFSPASGGRVSMEGIHPCSSFDELLQDDAVDAVAITLPTPDHAGLTVRALKAGKHVLCEKPMALTLRDCDRMIRAAHPRPRKRGTRARPGPTLMIAQCIRFWPQYELIKQQVDAGLVGKVKFVSLKRLGSPPGWSWRNWLMDHKRSGGALFDLHVHDIDFAHHLLGVPKRVHATGCRGPSGGIDHVLATYSYADGRYAVLEGGWVFTPPWKFDMGVTVVGEKGTLDWAMSREPEVLHYTGGQTPSTLAPDPGNGWTRELDYFVECVRARRPVSRCTPESSRLSIALAQLEKRSIETHRVITVPQTFAPR